MLKPYRVAVIASLTVALAVVFVATFLNTYYCQAWRPCAQCGMLVSDSLQPGAEKAALVIMRMEPKFEIIACILSSEL